jgi:hypothetical protein
METEFCGTEAKTEFLIRNENGNGTTFSGGTDVETELPFPNKVEYPFCD